MCDKASQAQKNTIFAAPPAPDLAQRASQG